jgi:hypothetical protein
MKYVRYALLCLTTAVLILIALMTANELAAIAGELGVFGQLLADPSVVPEAFRNGLIEYNLDSVWFAQNGPWVIFTLVVTIFFACIP